MLHFIGPVPSTLTWWSVIVTVPTENTCGGVAPVFLSTAARSAAGLMAPPCIEMSAWSHILPEMVKQN